MAIGLVFSIFRFFFQFLVVSHDSIRGCVRPLVGPSVRRSVRNLFFSAGRNEDGERLTSCIRTCSGGTSAKKFDKNSKLFSTFTHWLQVVLKVTYW